MMSELYDVIKQHLELKDNWYNNPYMPKERVEAFIAALQKFVSDTYAKGKADGQKEMLCGMSIFLNEVLEAKKKEAELFWDREQAVTSYIKWQKKMEEKKP